MIVVRNGSIRLGKATRELRSGTSRCPSLSSTASIYLVSCSSTCLGPIGSEAEILLLLGRLGYWRKENGEGGTYRIVYLKGHHQQRSSYRIWRLNGLETEYD